MDDLSARLDAVWRIEGASVVAALTRMTGDVATAEDCASEALVAALRQWGESGVPRNPGAWLTAVAKRRAIDGWRGGERAEARDRQLAHLQAGEVAPESESISDDELRLLFVSCHPVLSRESQVALTLRVVGGLSTTEIARLLLTSVATVQARITRAKKTLSAASVPFATPAPDEWDARLAGVLAVVYLIFTEGYASTTGTELLRPHLAREALRLGRMLAALTPAEPEVHGLVALMELQSSRFAARVDARGDAVLLSDQDRSRWDVTQIRRGREALARADSLGHGRGPYALQAAIAACHACAPSVESTDWETIVVLYEALGRLTGNPVVALNRAIAVSMVSGPEAGLAIVEQVADSRGLRGSHLLPSVRGELLTQLGRTAEAASELRAAADLAANDRVAGSLRSRAEALSSIAPTSAESRHSRGLSTKYTYE